MSEDLRCNQEALKRELEATSNKKSLPEESVKHFGLKGKRVGSQC
jgi:hypothetical protein